MAYEQCLLEIQKAAGRELTDAERKQIGDTVAGIMKRLDVEGRVDELSSAVMKSIDELVADIEAAAVIEKRNAALNARAKILNRDYISNVWKDDPKEGLKAILGNSLVDRQGSKNGVTAHIDALSHNYVSGVMSQLAEKDLTKLATSGTVDNQIWQAMGELNKPEPNVKGLLPEAVEIAKIFNNYSELARNNANAAGAWIKKLDGYVVKRSHDSLKISKAAGPNVKVGDPKHFEAWEGFLSQRLDWDKTMPDVAPEKRQAILRDMFEQFSNGVHVKFGEGGVAGLKGFANIGKRLSHERVLHFKTLEQEFEYNKAFGRDGSLTETVTNGLAHMARDTAIMRKLGPNARGNLEETVETLKKQYIKAGDGAKAKELSTEFDHQMKTLWPLIDGTASIPTNSSFAQWSQALRNIQIMGDLGGAVLSGISDIAGYASTMRYTGERNFGSFFKGMSDAVSTVVGGIGKGVTPEQMKIASEAGVIIDAISSPSTKLLADLNVPGRTTDWVQKFFKLNGLSWWQDRIRLGAVMGTAHRHAQYAGSAFDKLPAGMQSILRQFDISSKEWDTIRQSNIQTDSQGRNFITPESLADLDMKPRAKAELMDKYRALFSEVAAMATTEPGKVERSIMLQGTQPGTGMGEAMRHFWMYKSFTVSVMRKHLGRELFGYDVNRTGVAQALAKMVSDPGGSGFGGMTNMLLFGTLLGYGSMTMKDLAKGRTPRVPTDGESFMKIFAASAAQSGSMGIYGDFLFGEMKSRFGHGPLETFLGPTFKRGQDLADLWGRLKSGDDVAAKAMAFGLNNTPVVNGGYSLFYTRGVMDYLLIYRMQEMMNPGYLRRMENRLSKEKNQQYLVPPSSVIPYGGK